MGLSVTTRTVDDASIIVASGEIDIYTSPEFRRTVEPAVARAAAVVVDLTEVALLDSSGLTELARLTGRRGPRLRPVALVGLQPALLRLVELTELRGRFILADGVDEALGVLRERREAAS